MVTAKEPIPDYLENGIMVYFLYDHRFIFIQKRYTPDKQNWFTRLKRKKPEPTDEDFTQNNYYVHGHKQVIKIDNDTIKRKDEKIKYDTLIPDTDIYVGLLRSPITEGNLRLYYAGKYTSIKSTYGGFLTRYLTGLKSSFVTRTKNITNKADVPIERWYVYPDIPQNQSVFIL